MSTPNVSSWVARDGLEIRLELPAEPIRGEELGKVAPVRALLRLRNARPEGLRIYMIASEPFRSFQSSLTVFAPTGGLPITSQPPPRPHGYVVTERDFPLLAPGEERTFEQSLYVSHVKTGGQGVEREQGFEKGGSFRVVWRYSNTVTSWKGNVMTLDGPTHSLFDGGPIPAIWTGEVAAEATLVVAP